jgi:hypothetical protein
MTETSLQYPIGRFTTPATITPAMRDAAIAELIDTPFAMRSAVDGLTTAQLDTPYREGGWTVRQVVHHVADSHMHAYIRVKFALTEDSPTIRPYDEGAWALLPDVAVVPVTVSLSLIDGIHARWTACLAGTAADQMTRPFVHPELGPQPLDLSLLRYAWHGRHHVAHITSLRTRMGW